MANSFKDTISLPLPLGLLQRVNVVTSFLSRYLEVVVLLLATLVSFIAWRHYFDAGLVLSYNDAMSHLDISRRVVEGLKPGLAQLGSVWLPLPHVLPLVFIWNDFLWHSGLAGSIVSSLAFIGSAFYIYRLGYLFSSEKLVGLLASFIYILNPNIIYMQATPMTESLLLFFFIATSYYVFLWYVTDSYKYLFLTGLFTFFSTLTRYDGWMLMGQVLIVVALLSFKKGGFKKAESNLVLYTTIALYGIILWLVWNYLIFGDPLYFAFGPFSARSQQLVFEGEGRLFTKGNLLYSSYVYALTIVKNNGLLMTFLATVGAGYFFFKNRFFNSKALAISALLSPLFFNISALYLGHSIVNLDTLPPYTLFNVRYGLMMLPAVAIFSAYLARKDFFLKIMLAVFLLIQTVIVLEKNDVITVKDGVYGASAQEMTETGKWLHNEAKDRGEALILIAASSQDALIFQSKMPMKRFIHEGTGDFWKKSLIDPTLYAEYVAMHKGDLVYNAMAKNENFLRNYERIYDGRFTDIYKKVSDKESKVMMDESQLP